MRLRLLLKPSPLARARGLSHQGKDTQVLPQKEAPEEAGGEEQTEAFVLRSFSPAVGTETLRNPSAGCCALRGQGAEGVCWKWWCRRAGVSQGGAGGSWWVCEHPCPDKTSQAFPESRQGLGTIHPGNKSGSHRRDPRMRERGTRELGQALGSVFLEQEGERWKEGCWWSRRALGDCQV